MLFVQHFIWHTSMHNEQLFDHKSLQIYSLLMELHLKNNHLSKTELCTCLKITAPTLTQLIEHINSFDPHILTVTRHEVILELPYKSSTITNLNHTLLATSPKFQLLDTYFKHSYLTREEAAQQLNISLTSINKLVGECNTLLKEFKLELKQNMVRGLGIQYFYFYYNFYWNNPHIGNGLDNIVLSDHGFKDFASTKLNCDLNIIQVQQISLWLSLLSAKHELLQKYFVHEERPENFYAIRETPLFQMLLTYFKQNWTYLNVSIIEYYSYLTFIFLNIHNVIYYPITEINSLFVGSECQQLLEQVTTILTNSYSFNDNFISLRSSLYFTINKLLLLDGYYYAYDVLVLKNSARKTQPFEEKVIQEILQIPVSLGFKLPAYKLTAIRDNLRMMIYPYKNLKRQALQIGVISQLPIATRYAYITGMQNILNKDHNVVVSDFVAHNHYDLIISDFELTEPQQFHTPILTLDDLNIQSNLTLLEKTIAKLESERYQPLILQ